MAGLIYSMSRFTPDPRRLRCAACSWLLLLPPPPLLGLPRNVRAARIHHFWYEVCRTGTWCRTYDRTNLSRLSQSGFSGLKVMNLLKRTWATGAMPIGAPGWPELALKVAST